MCSQCCIRSHPVAAVSWGVVASTTAVCVQVRTMLTKGELDKAETECQTVTEGHIATLLSDPAAWKEYVAGWDLTRKYAVSQAAIDISGPGNKVRPADLAHLHQQRHTKDRSRASSIWCTMCMACSSCLCTLKNVRSCGGCSLCSQGDAVMQAKGKAQRDAGAAAVANSDAILADIMAEIEGRAPAKSAAEFAAQNVSMPATAASKAAKVNGKKAAATAAPADVSTPAAEAFMKRAAEESKAEKSKAEKSKAEKSKAEKVAPAPAKAAAPPATEADSKPAASKARARAAPMYEDEPFVPPAMYLSKQAPEPTAAEQKAQIRQEQMAKAAEAEARKKQQAERKTKKAEKVRLLILPTRI